MEANQLIGDRYKVQEPLGEGGMGIVYRGYDIVLERPVAIKVLSGSVIGTEGRARLLREARAAARLSHPSIVAVFDAGEADSNPFVVMELIDGATLRETSAPSLDNAIRIMQDICLALDHAHHAGIIHRDLKPENVMMTDGGTAKLMDFGLALSAGASRLTEEGAIVGTFSYLAPELVMGEMATEQSDLYALGVIIYELVTGRHPFRDDNLVGVISQHLHAPVVPPSTYNPEIPPALEAIILRLMEKNPGDRFASARQVLDELAMIATDQAAEPSASQVVLPDISATPTASSTRFLERMVRGRIVGRSVEVAEMRSFWHRAEDGNGHLLLLSGEPGIGKTRLAEELAVYARLRGGMILKGSFHPELGVTYLGIREALQNYIRSRQVDEVRKTIGSAAPELVKLVPDVADIMGDVTPNPPLGEVEAERLRLFDHITQYLLRLAENAPILLLMEDLHWADKPSLLFLHYFLRHITESPILVLGTYREVALEPARPFYEAMVGLNRERLYTRLIVQRLGSESVARLMSTLLDGEVAAELADAINRETEGNPFFIEEVLKSLIERGALRRENGTWSAAADVQVDVPQSLQIAVGERLDGLTDDANLALTMASVLGREFDVDVLLGLGEWDEDQLLDALDEAEKAQIVTPVAGTAGDRYAFAHALLVQVLYEGINTRRRARYHQRAGASIERVHAKRLDDHTEDLSYHFSQARTDAAEKAVTYSLKAAEKAVAVHAHEQAINQYKVALEALVDLDEPEQIARVSKLLGDTLYATYDSAGAISAYETGLAALEQAGIEGGDMLWRLTCQLGQVLAYSTGKSEETQAVLKRALALIPEAGVEEERAKCQAALAFTLSGTPDLELALEQAQGALKMAQEARSQAGMASAYGALCMVHRMQDDLEAYFEAARKQAEALAGSDDLHSRFSAYWNASTAAWMRGRYADAEKFALESRQISEKLNVPGWEALTLAAYTGILSEQGRWDQALSHVDRVLPLFRELGGDSCFCYIFANMAQIEARRGYPEHTRKFISDALDVFHQLEGYSSETAILRWHFFEHVYLEEWDDAWKVAREMHQGGQPLISLGSASAFLWSCALPQVAARVGEYEQAVSLANEALEVAQKPELPPLITASHFALGVAYAGQEKWDDALREYSDALTRFRLLGRPWDIANTLFEMGEAYIQQGKAGNRDKALEAFQEAREIFESLKAQPGLDKVQQALRAYR